MASSMERTPGRPSRATEHSWAHCSSRSSRSPCGSTPQAAEARVAHLRTRRGDHEIDLIVQRADHRVVALEVKLSANVDDRDLRHLRWLADRIGPDLLDAAVITTGPEAYRREDGIGVIPAALLTA